MATILLLISVCATDDYDPSKTYEFIQKGSKPIEERQVFGRIVEKRPDGWLVEIDAPWENRRVITLRDDMLESGPLLETEAMREKRIEEGWKEKGFTKVTTADNQTAFVLTEEVKLAERAREAAPGPPEPFEVPEEALLALEQPLTPEATESQTPEGLPPWAQRAGQAALILVALGLAGVIARFTVFSDA